MSPGPLTARKEPTLSGGFGESCCFENFSEQKREQVPDREVEYGANDEAVYGEISLRDLFEVLAKMLILNVAERLRPDVEPVYSKEDRDEEHEKQRQGAHGRAQNAADDHAPGSAGEVADHENRHGAEGDAKPAHEAEQVSAVKLIRLLEG